MRARSDHQQRFPYSRSWLNISEIWKANSCTVLRRELCRLRRASGREFGRSIRGVFGLWVIQTELLELRDELPGQRWNKGLQTVIAVRGPVIHGRRRMPAIEPAHLDRIARLAPFEVVADVFLAAGRH